MIIIQVQCCAMHMEQDALRYKIINLLKQCISKNISKSTAFLGLHSYSFGFKSEHTAWSTLTLAEGNSSPHDHVFII